MLPYRIKNFDIEVSAKNGFNPATRRYEKTKVREIPGPLVMPECTLPAKMYDVQVGDDFAFSGLEVPRETESVFVAYLSNNWRLVNYLHSASEDTPNDCLKAFKQEVRQPGEEYDSIERLIKGL